MEEICSFKTKLIEIKRIYFLFLHAKYKCAFDMDAKKYHGNSDSITESFQSYFIYLLSNIGKREREKEH